MANFDAAVAKTLAHEGGFFHNTVTGEVVNMGVTLATYRALVDPDATEDTIRNLNQFQARAFYSAYFWLPLHCDRIADDTLAAKVFDLAVNQGIGTASTELQEAVNDVDPGRLKVDGKIGDMTIGAVNSLRAVAVLNALIERAKARYRQISEANPALAGDLAGWLARADS